jgi:peroxiredoxin
MKFFGRKPRLAAAGNPASDFRLQLLDGDEETLASLCGKGPFLLAFYKVTCPVCQLTLPFLERIHQGGSLAIYAVSQDDSDDSREFNRRYGLHLPTLLDPEDGNFPASNAYGISTVPTMFLIEEGGTISQVIEGWSKGDIAALGRRAGVDAIRQSDKVPEWKPG